MTATTEERPERPRLYRRQSGETECAVWRCYQHVVCWPEKQRKAKRRMQSERLSDLMIVMIEKAISVVTLVLN